jgi:hypothetical protein
MYMVNDPDITMPLRQYELVKDPQLKAMNIMALTPEQKRHSIKQSLSDDESDNE